MKKLILISLFFSINVIASTAGECIDNVVVNRVSWLKLVDNPSSTEIQKSIETTGTNADKCINSIVASDNKKVNLTNLKKVWGTYLKVNVSTLMPLLNKGQKEEAKTILYTFQKDRLDEIRDLLNSLK